MALLLPIKIDGRRFFVNPTEIEVKTTSQISEVRTMGGTVFQAWPDLPNEIGFKGMAFGLRAFRELQNLKKAANKNFLDKEVIIKYKFRAYKGFLKNLTVTNSAEKPRQFEYSFDFVSRTPWEIGFMPFGQTLGIKAEFDFIEAQIRGAGTRILGLTANIYADVASVAGSVSRVGLNIGRPLANSIKGPF